LSRMITFVVHPDCGDFWKYVRSPIRLSDRKLRLFLIGCCRRHWDLFDHPDFRRAIEVAERYVEGLVGEGELMTARRAVMTGKEQWSLSDQRFGLAQAARSTCKTDQDLRTATPSYGARYNAVPTQTGVWKPTAAHGPYSLAFAVAQQDIDPVDD